MHCQQAMPVCSACMQCSLAMIAAGADAEKSANGPGSGETEPLVQGGCRVYEGIGSRQRPGRAEPSLTRACLGRPGPA